MPTHPADPATRHYRGCVAYDGSGFYGWQRQILDGVELRTVQHELESAANRVLKPTDRRVVVHGASRTDTGVHAQGQLIRFHAATRIPADRIARAITSRLPEDVAVTHIEPADPDFCVFRQVRDKQYRYRVFTGNRRPLTVRHQVYHCFHELDLVRMQEAARQLVGTHDFAGFSAAGHGRATTVRTVHACEVQSHRPPTGDEVHLVVRGDGFLYNMVRIIAGTLVDLGRGQAPPDAVQRTLASRDRRDAGRTLTAAGLTLEWIRTADGFRTDRPAQAVEHASG